MSGLYVAVGIPGCGKSTHAEQLLANGRVDILVSTDRIREQLTGDPSNQDANGEVFRIMHGRVRAALSVHTLNIMVDATNLRTKDRLLIKSYAEDGDIAIAFRFADSADFDLCQKRNENRKRVVPLDIMQRFHKTFLQECSPEKLLAEGWKVVNI